MAKNNLMYKFYSEMTKGYREKNSGLFENGIRCWMMTQPENPFPKGSEEAECFFEMEMAYTIWSRGGADMRINWRRMLDAARRLCEINPKRPYKFDKVEDTEDRKQAAEEEAAAAAKAEEDAKKAEKERLQKEAATKEAEEEEKDIMHVFGVIPEVKIKDKEAKELKVSRLKNLFKR